MFHRNCGDGISLMCNNRTAVRNLSDYNYGLVLSADCLQDDQIFEVRIDKKITKWDGNIEIGITSAVPDNIDLPASATDLCCSTWIMTNCGVVYNSELVVELYGINLDILGEGSTLGVMRTSNAELIFLINGISQGIAATNIPPHVYAFIDMYGNCVQVTITQPRLLNDPKDHSEFNNNDYAIQETSSSSMNNHASNHNVNSNVNVNMNLPKNVGSTSREDKLRFHDRVGSLVKLSNNARTAERQIPLDEFNKGVVMTHRPLKDDELFEIRIDQLVEKWSGSIEVGVTTHSPASLEFPATMTNMRSGTTMMSGSGILNNGKSTQKEYGEFNLDELREGDRVGMIRKTGGNLHYYINGLDQGVAANVPPGVWGVIDLYGMTAKVTIVDRDEREEQNLVTRRNTMHLQGLNEGADEVTDRLYFHPCCGSKADVINNGRTAHRPNADNEFNNGVVLTSRTLKPNELFEVRLDKIAEQWAGSIEIGVTTHSPTKLEFPFTMTNVRSGTWMMTGNGVMHNGITSVEQYGQNLDKLQIGDRVGVMRKDSSTLHFYVNGVDQGPAARGVPEKIYGVIDLYGQAAQVTIVDNREFSSPATNNSSLSNTTLYNDMRFHLVHGKNARITNNGFTASRPRALGEFNDAIVIGNRAMRDGEMFEVSIDRMVGRWTGAIEAGVTAIKPYELEFPPTMTDIDHDTWMLSGSTVMRDGTALRLNYACDLDRLVEGNRIGMMRWTDGTLHYYLDGVDQGVACSDIPSHIYPVIDLYGQCAQVTITLPEQRDTVIQRYLPSENSNSQQPTSVIQPQAQTETSHKFHLSVGLNIRLNNDRTNASRCREYNNAILISEAPLESNELFEITIQEVAQEWSGALRIGVMRSSLASWLTVMNLVPGMTAIPADAWYLSGNQVRHKVYVLSSNYCPSLEWLRVNDKIGLKVTHDGNLKFYINGEDMGIAATNLPEVYVVVDLFGSTTAIAITSSKQPNTVISPNASLRLQDSLELLLDPTPPIMRNDTGMDTSVDTSEAKLLNEMVVTPTQPLLLPSSEDWGYEFHENHGRNVQLDSKTVAKRVASYNQGVVLTSRPLIKNKMFQIRIDKTNERWVSNILCGVTCISPEKANFPLTALGFKKHSWIICSDWISHNGTKVKTKYGANLEDIQCNSTLGLLIDEDSRLHMYINDVDQGVAATDLPPYVYAVIDLYGQCEQISIINSMPDVYLNTDNNTISPVDRTSTESEDIENSREKAALECHEKENGTPAISLNLSLNIPLQVDNSNDERTSTPYPSNSSSNLDACLDLSNSTEHSKNKPYINNLILMENNTDLCNVNEECSNVEINNATNINIKNGSNAINVNFASNSQNIDYNSHENNVQEQLQTGFSRFHINNFTNNTITDRGNNIHNSLPSTPIGNLLSPIKKCEYLKACTRFKKSLVLPDEFFSLDEVTCYCNSCCKLEADSIICKKGEPLAEYVVPVSWVRFPLKQSINANQIPQNIIDKWHVAFYAAKIETIRWILDRGEILTKEQLDMSNLTSTTNAENKNPQVIFSPNIKNANLDKFSKQYPYIDTELNKKLNASTAFQLLVRPGSYTINSNKDGVDSSIESIEWSTKEAGDTAIVELLIHLDGF